MKHFKIILFVFAAMSLTTCTSVDTVPEKIPAEKVEKKKVYYTLEEQEDELQTGELNSSEHEIIEIIEE